MITRQSDLPAAAYRNLASPPQPESMQFYSGYFSPVAAGSYTINVTHTVTGASGTLASYQQTQPVSVDAPQFTIDPNIVTHVYPPAASSADYSSTLPYVVLSDPALPWERALVPGGAVGQGNPPWLALILLGEDEIKATAQPEVSAFIAKDSTGKVLKPSGLTPAPQVLGTRCQTITIPKSVFDAVMPSQNDLQLMAHCQAMNSGAEGQALLSVLIANRMPRAGKATTTMQAHIVSLEGFADALPGGSASPTAQLVELATLYHWQFKAQPETPYDFKTIVNGLSDLALALPQPNTPNPPASMTKRLNDGYVPLDFRTGSGDETFAWYRGPLSPVMSHPLPKVDATNADALTIYVEGDGVFDLSYAAAWNIGRGLALADGRIAQAIATMHLRGKAALGALSQRLALPGLAGENDPHALLARDASRSRFAQRIAGGLGEAIADGMAGRRNAARNSERAPRRRRTIHPRALLARDDVRDAIAKHVAEPMDIVAAWLAQLMLLEPVPFSHLVAHPAMLPGESIRFFFVDQNWLDALLAGAASIAIKSSADAALMNDVFRPALDARLPKRPVSGVVVRSQLVPDFPTAIIEARKEGKLLAKLRDDTVSSSVRIALFDDVPDAVFLREPYHGLRFGTEDGTLQVRSLATGSVGKAQRGTTVKPQFRAKGSDVLDIQGLATTLQGRIHSAPNPLDAGDFAIQLIQAPDVRTFTSSSKEA